jgi:SAM-dependent methyltransferase
MIRALKQYIFAQQFNPGFIGLWVNPFYHARRGLYREIARAALQLNGRVLDVGCGCKPYRQLFPSCDFVGLELDTPQNRANKQADYFYDGNTFPFSDRSFDGVLCNQVLEHVFAPDQLLNEIGRVLTPSGSLLLTVPFVWDEHEQPWDYARYSTFGLKHLLEKNGFEVWKQIKINADVRALFQMANAYLFKVLSMRQPVADLVVCAVVMAPVNILGALLYRVLPANPDLYLDQLVIARKATG